MAALIKLLVSLVQPTGRRPESILAPLRWLVGFLITALLIHAAALQRLVELGADAPHQVEKVLIGLVAGTVCVYLAAYVYFARHDPDRLQPDDRPDRPGARRGAPDRPPDRPPGQ